MLKKVLLFCLVLCLPSLSFGQVFNSILDPSIYPDRVPGAYIPVNSDQAILAWRVEPRGNFNNVTEAKIISRVDYEVIQNENTYGWGYFTGVSGESGFNQYYTICDASTLYIRSSSLSRSVLNQIQSLLVAQNLGTVKQRAAYIRSFYSGPVQILDIDNFKKSILNALSPFLNIYLGIFLTLFVVDLMSKKSKDVIAESAKIQRRAERAQQRREIRADPTAQIFEFRLANFSSIASGSVLDPSISRRKARRLFEDTALEYAEYKKSRGWKY